MLHSHGIVYFGVTYTSAVYTHIRNLNATKCLDLVVFHVCFLCACTCIIGPGTQPPTVRTSGTNVDQVLTSFSANISFVINDDLAALEDMEIYTLTLIPSDSSFNIVQDTSQITILENDGKLHICTHMCTAESAVIDGIYLFFSAEINVGFPYEEMTFDASAVRNATMFVFGEALQSFTVNFVHGIS